MQQGIERGGDIVIETNPCRHGMTRYILGAFHELYTFAKYGRVLHVHAVCHLNLLTVP